MANSVWFEDVFGHHIGAVAAAQERGRERDLDGTVAELLEELER